jgi:hypothetical protein
LQDWEWKSDYGTSKLWRFILLATFATFSGIGYYFGKKEAVSDNWSKFIIDLEAEEQIFDSLINKEKPVFLYYYIPNHWFSIDLHDGVEDAS